MSERNAGQKRCKSNSERKRVEVRGAKYLRQITDLLAPLQDHRPDPKRKLHYDEFCAWLLLYFFNPTINSMRGLQQVSDLAAVRRRVGLRRFSLGSFSEASQVFDPELLAPIMAEIGDRLSDIEPDRRLHKLGRRPTAVDGTLLEALPEMVWALWIDKEHRAAKMHLQFDLLNSAPHRATLTPGQGSEIGQLRANLEPGRLYLQDRGYFDYKLMAAILKAESSFVMRVRGNIDYDVLEPNDISEENARKGVEADWLVRVGSKPNQQTVDQPLRLVRIRVRETDPSPRRANRTRERDYTLVLLTDLLTLDVALIGLLYRYRWQIELFFRWFKKVLQANHLLALSENGMKIVMYCALIATQLIVLWTGRKPTKRTFELLCFYFAGWLTDQELQTHLDRLAAAAQKTR
jgi:hypothetical protein